MPRAFDLDLERRWRERLREFERSGSSVREFCRLHGLQEYTFFWWRRELARRNRLRPSGQATPRRAPKHRATRRANHWATRRANRRYRANGESDSRAVQARRGCAFVPVQVITESLGDSCMEFRLGAGLVRVPTTIDELALRRAIRVLREEATGC